MCTISAHSHLVFSVEIYKKLNLERLPSKDFSRRIEQLQSFEWEFWWVVVVILFLVVVGTLKVGNIVGWCWWWWRWRWWWVIFLSVVMVEELCWWWWWWWWWWGVLILRKSHFRPSIKKLSMNYTYLFPVLLVQNFSQNRGEYIG